MMRSLARTVFQLITRTRKFYYRRLKELAPSARAKRVLEIGSGKPTGSSEGYSAIHIFSEVAEFRQTDLNPEFGHELLDITQMDIDGEYDLILCLNVLEHIFETGRAVENLHKALAPGGMLIVAVPFAFPLHDEPHDYYRFTRYALEKMLSGFARVTVEIWGPGKMPFGHFVIAEKAG